MPNATRHDATRRRPCHPATDLVEKAMSAKLIGDGDRVGRIAGREQLAVTGGRSLWLRVRCLTEDAPNDTYTTAQFGRLVRTGAPVLAIRALPAAAEATA